MSDTDNLVAALELGKLGYRVTPLRPSRDGIIPAFDAWRPELAVSDAAAIQQWWGDDGRRGIAWLLPADVVRLDVDVRGDVDGHASLARLETEHGPLPATRAVATPRSGRHYFFRAAQLEAGGRVAPGVELLTGRWAPLPPTRRHGGAYRWLSGRSAVIATLPGWVAQIAATAKPAASRATVRDDASTLERLGLAGVPPTLYRLRDGSYADRWGSVRCWNPHHDDHHASAFVLRLGTGQLLLGCSVCPPDELRVALDTLGAAAS